MPYTAMTVHVSETAQGRDSATAYRMCFEVLSVLLAAVCQGVLLSQVGGTATGSCRNCTATAVESDHQEQRSAYVLSAMVLAGIMVACGLTSFFVVKERPQLEGA